MTEQELNAIEQRIDGRHRPFTLGDNVLVEVDYANGLPEKRGVITGKAGAYVYVDHEKIHASIVQHDEPSAENDIRALLAEVRRVNIEFEKVQPYFTAMRNMIETLISIVPEGERKQFADGWQEFEEMMNA